MDSINFPKSQPSSHRHYVNTNPDAEGQIRHRSHSDRLQPIYTDELLDASQLLFSPENAVAALSNLFEDAQSYPVLIGHEDIILGAENVFDVTARDVSLNLAKQDIPPGTIITFNGTFSNLTLSGISLDDLQSSNLILEGTSLYVQVPDGGMLRFPNLPSLLGEDFDQEMTAMQVAQALFDGEEFTDRYGESVITVDNEEQAFKSLYDNLVRQSFQTLSEMRDIIEGRYDGYDEKHTAHNLEAALDYSSSPEQQEFQEAIAPDNWSSLERILQQENVQIEGLYISPEGGVHMKSIKTI